MSNFDSSGTDADRHEISGAEIVGTVKAMRFHKECRNGSWTSSMQLLVVDEAGSECRVYDSSRDAERRFEMLAEGDTVEVSGRRQRWAPMSVGGATVADTGFASRTVLVAEEIEVGTMPAGRLQQRALERAKASAVATAAAADSMRGAVEEFLGAGGSPPEAQEAVAGVLAGGAGIDDWLSSEAEMIVQNWTDDVGVCLEM